MSTPALHLAGPVLPGLVRPELKLTMPAGGRLLVRGRSGSGKSSLLDAIATRRRLSDGMILVLGYNLSGRLAQVADGERLAQLRARGIACVEQHPRFIEQLSAAEHFRLYASLYGEPDEPTPDEVQDRAHGLLSELEGAPADRPLSRLSVGERHRVALAWALARPAALIVLDEPFAALDAHRARIAGMLIEQRLTHGKSPDGGPLSLVISSHDADSLIVTDRLIDLEAA